ncbi:hypothetical protein [Nostoc sp. CENA543]|uniref:hypothetical protein n=1 Tax=Nostoc sp. CENA543 TaxID=1869241 RepID=UPI0012FFFAFB|nr:hypothetical protein [Nostoc sp. CENA543]
MINFEMSKTKLAFLLIVGTIMGLIASAYATNYETVNPTEAKEGLVQGIIKNIK